MKKQIMLSIIEKAKNINSKEVPVYAAIFKDGELVSESANTKEHEQNPCAHAEINAIIKAAKVLDSWRLDNCELYVTLEPCMMCAGAIIQSRIRKVYYAASDPKGGAIQSCFQAFNIVNINHRPAWESGICEDEASELLKTFFKKIRVTKK